MGMKLFGRGTNMALGLMKRVVGFDLFADIQEFLQAFSGMVGGFEERARRVDELLRDKKTAFLIVCGPRGEPIEEAVYFHRKLVEAKLPFGGVIVNKVHTIGEGASGDGTLEAAIAAALDDEKLAEKVAGNYRDYRELAERDRRNIDRLTRELKADRVLRVPYLDEDVHDLRGLAEINRYLFAA